MGRTNQSLERHKTACKPATSASTCVPRPRSAAQSAAVGLRGADADDNDDDDDDDDDATLALMRAGPTAITATGEL
jgi:hypothetical protein